MEEFDLILGNIKLNIICESYMKDLIIELMNGHLNITNHKDGAIYNLVMVDNFVPKQYEYYFNMTDKWFDNATCDVWIDNKSKTIYASNIQASNVKYRNLLIQYFVCNLFNRLLEETGFIAFHSSCVEKNHSGIAFIAARNSGKTNCMLNLMSKGYNSVTNDKLGILFDKEHLIGYGVAQDVSIRITENFCKQSQNQKYIPIALSQGINISSKNLLEGNNIHLESMELARINGVDQVATTNIFLFISPTYDASLNEALFRKMSDQEKKELLESQSLPLVHETKKFLKNIKTELTQIYPSEKTLQKIEEQDFYKVVQSENTLDSFTEGIKQLIKKQKH